MRNRNKTAAAAAAITLSMFGLVTLPGCGGAAGLLGAGLVSGGLLGQDKPPRQATPKLDINWAGRSRGVNAPSSALSAVITLESGGNFGENASLTVNRRSEPAAYTETVTLPKANVGDNTLEIRFMSRPDGEGATVGEVRSEVKIQDDGTGIGDVATTGRLAFVEITAGQTVAVGQKTALSYEARDVADNNLAVSPGSVFWSVTAGGEFLRIGEDGKAEGLAPGTASVIATVDGKASAPATITVQIPTP